MKRFTVSEESSLKNFTDNTCAQASFCFRRLLKAREIRVNGVKVGENVPLRRGDEVCYFMTPAEEAKPAFSVLYEDENVLVLDKESGVNSEAVFAETGCRGVHRLDRNTEGVMILAKNGEAESELLAAFKEKRIKKEYLALVLGKFSQPHAVERAFLHKDERSATVRVGSQGGTPIETEYEVLEERGECSLLKIILHTGKTHQIRAHMAYLGHPVAGDEKYGDAAFNKRMHATRQKLLSKSLTVKTGGILAYLSGRTFVSPKNL